jgi:spermidine synthase
MISQPQLPSDPASSRRHLPVLLLLFVGSGCAALIYEIVWFQLLRLAIGSTAISLGVLLGSFMGGMCLGSIGLPQIISVRWHPLRVYALLELGIGTIAVALLFLLPLVGHFYAANVGPGAAGIAFRGLVSAACLLPPTVLMGATLPAIARWMETSPVGVARLGFFYGANIAGAVFGCLLAGFFLLRVYDVGVATFVAVAIDGTIAVAGLALAAVSPYRAAACSVEQLPCPTNERAEPGDRSAAAARPWSVYVAIALSGMSAMGAEVIWTRQLSLLLGATVYTFSVILAVFLVGLGIGSGVGSVLSRGQTSPRLLLGWCQMLLVAAIGWTALIVGRSLPYWPIDPSLASSPWYSFQLDLVRCFWAMLPAACLWGASFPLALAAAASRHQDPGRLVGRIYAANTVGAIVGSLAFSIVMIAWVGTQRAQQLLIVASASAALLMFGPLLWRPTPGRSGDDPRPLADGLWGWLGAVAMAGFVCLAVWSVPQLPEGLVAYGRNVAKEYPPDFIYFEEGVNASIAVSEDADGLRCFHVSGKVVASNDPADMRLQRMLGHLPALIHPHPRSALVVGCGAGVTAGSLVPYPDMERIVICEIEALVPDAAAWFFSEENYGVVDDPRTQLIYDDARHYVLTTKEKFDIITSDPIHPWVRGAATLYSVEYFQHCREHLNEGGVIAQWVPLYETNVEAVKSEIATFMKVFPNGTIWSNDVNGSGYDMVLLGQVGPSQIDVKALQERLDRSDHQSVRQSLKEVNFASAIDLLATYAGRGPDLKAWLADAQINQDRNLRLEYLAGMALNLHHEDEIFKTLLKHRRYPKSLFVASDALERSLKTAMEPPP